MKISGWGNSPRIDAEVFYFRSNAGLAAKLAGDSANIIARGLGRSYGDPAIARIVASTAKFARVRAFDRSTGEITCESGVTIEELIEAFLPQGWFPPVTPGTKFVTVGGAIAADVHGKNHHLAGSFCQHVTSMEIMMADGSVATCSRTENPDLFRSVCGGMGLTGIILTATFRLMPVESAYIRQETVKARNIAEIIELFDRSASWTYSVAWIDCLSRGDSMGRSILMLGEFCTRAEAERISRKPLEVPPKLKLSVPFDFPGFALSSPVVKAFNSLYYAKAPHGTSKNIVDYDKFFYPLDSIHSWNRIYGKRGFTQYQLALPRETQAEGLRRILDKISASGQGSFLAVLKSFGKQDGLISFPMEGCTLALDFPLKPSAYALFAELDPIVADFGGRLYLAKDVRMTGEFFRKTYPGAGEFLALKNKFDPQGKFGSLQSKRLEIF